MPYPGRMPLFAPPGPMRARGTQTPRSRSRSPSTPSPASPRGQAKAKAKPKARSPRRAQSPKRGRKPAGKGKVGWLAGLVAQLGEIFKNTLIDFLCQMCSVLIRFVMSQIQFYLPPLLGSLVLARIPPGFWHTDLARWRIYLDEVYTAELLALVGFLLWGRWMLAQGAIPSPASPRVRSSGNEIGLMLGWAGILVGLWAPRASAVVFGIFSIGAFRRAGAHFDPGVCVVTSASLLGCCLRLVWGGPAALALGAAVSGGMFLMDCALLGRRKRSAEEHEERVKELQQALSSALPGTLLLSAVAPSTLYLYMTALFSFVTWRKERGAPPMETIADLDDALASWIQYHFDRWQAGLQVETRQLCVLARCGLQLLRPRLTGKLQVSGKMLEAWKRVSPAVHYTPLPYVLLVLFVKRLFEVGNIEVALMTWLTFHCLLRPGEALLLRGGELVLPPTLGDILGGELGALQIRMSKRARATRFASTGPEVLKPRQVVIFDKALMVLLWIFVQGKQSTERVFANASGDGWRRILSSLADHFWVPQLQIVPRSLRPGGAVFLHVERHWPLADLVIRGGWSRFESTHSYLQTGLYAAIGLNLMPQVRVEGRAWVDRWPRGLRLPSDFRGALGDENLHLFEIHGGPSWGLESAMRGLAAAAAPPPREPATRRL